MLALRQTGGHGVSLFLNRDRHRSFIPKQRQAVHLCASRDRDWADNSLFLNRDRHFIPKQRQALHLCASRDSIDGPGDDDENFDRKEEMAFFRKFVRKKGRLLLLAGPRDCGKSAVLKQLAHEQEEHVVLVNLRRGDCTTPEGFIKQIQRGLVKSFSFLDEKLVQFLRTAFEGLTLRLQVGPDRMDSLVAFQDLLWDYLMLRRSKGFSAPTFVFDEANLLQLWLPDKFHHRVLSTYLNFFVLVTKEECLANVVLVSSDFFFKFFLNGEIGASRFAYEVIGVFPEAEARGFFESTLGKPCADDTWNSVYRLHGGLALSLKVIAECIQDGESWENLTLQLFRQMMDHADMGFSPESVSPKGIAASWTSLQYLDILAKMTQYPQGVTPFCVLQGLYGTNVLKALICYNLIQYRTKSYIARDIAWYKGPTPVAMPLSQIHWLVMRELAGRKQLGSMNEQGDLTWEELMKLANPCEKNQQAGGS